MTQATGQQRRAAYAITKQKDTYKAKHNYQTSTDHKPLQGRVEASKKPNKNALLVPKPIPVGFECVKDNATSKGGLGQGGQNTVCKIDYAFKDLSGNNFTLHAAFKPLQKTAHAAAAESIGIDATAPNMEQRNITAYRLACLLGCPTLVPYAQWGQDKAGNWGLVMELAPGKESHEMFKKYPELRNHPEVRRQLILLQLLDALCGQADRHERNYMIDYNPQTKAVRVTGIDNDQAFGEKTTHPHALLKLHKPRYGYDAGDDVTVPPKPRFSPELFERMAEELVVNIGKSDREKHAAFVDFIEYEKVFNSKQTKEEYLAWLKRRHTHWVNEPQTNAANTKLYEQYARRRAEERTYAKWQPFFQGKAIVPFADFLKTEAGQAVKDASYMEQREAYRQHFKISKNDANDKKKQDAYIEKIRQEKEILKEGKKIAKQNKKLQKERAKLQKERAKLQKERTKLNQERAEILNNHLGLNGVLLPPVVDIEMYHAIKNLKVEELKEIVLKWDNEDGDPSTNLGNGLTEEEEKAFLSRFEAIKKHLDVLVQQTDGVIDVEDWGNESVATRLFPDVRTGGVDNKLFAPQGKLSIKTRDAVHKTGLFIPTSYLARDLLYNSPYGIEDVTNLKKPKVAKPVLHHIPKQNSSSQESVYGSSKEGTSQTEETVFKKQGSKPIKKRKGSQHIEFGDSIPLNNQPTPESESSSLKINEKRDAFGLSYDPKEVRRLFKDSSEGNYYKGKDSSSS